MTTAHRCKDTGHGAAPETDAAWLRIVTSLQELSKSKLTSSKGSNSIIVAMRYSENVLADFARKTHAVVDEIFGDLSRRWYHDLGPGT